MGRESGLGLMCALTVLCGGCEREPAAAEPLVRPVRYERVALQGSEERRTFSGTTRAALETDLSFKVAGTLTALYVEVGDAVQRGDPLARLDATDYAVRVQEAEAGLAQARAQLRNAEAAYERTRSLYENRNASRSDLDASRAAAESADAAVRAANQQLEAARLQLSYTRLSAPQDCTVAATYAKENENVSAGQPVAQLNCGDCAEIVVAVPQGFIGRIREGGRAQVLIDALPGEAVTAVVTEVGVAAVGTTYPVTAQVDGDCPALRSGMAADVRFVLDREGGQRRIAVPPVAVGEDRDGNYVFVLEVDESGRWFARRRAVEVAGVGPDGVIVGAGLAEGELIVTAGVRRIADGLQVRLLDAEG